MPGPKLFGMEGAGEEETEPPTGRVVHVTARFHKLLAGTAVALPVAGRAQQLSIWTIESFNISREPCVDLHVDVCIDCAFFVASGVAERLGITPAQYQAWGWIPWAAGYRDVGRSGMSGGSPKALERYSQPFINGGRGSREG